MAPSALVVAEIVHPAKLSSADLTGKAFDNTNTIAVSYTHLRAHET